MVAEAAVEASILPLAILKEGNEVAPAKMAEPPRKPLLEKIKLLADIIQSLFIYYSI